MTTELMPLLVGVSLELSSTRKLLLVNKKNTAAQVSVDAALKGRKATAWFVDETYATEPSPRVELAVHGYRNATFAPFNIKCIILPRQAQDKHRKNLQKEWRFLGKSRCHRTLRQCSCRASTVTVTVVVGTHQCE